MATIPDSALPRIARLLGGVDSVAPFTIIMVGTGTTAESTSQTALVTQVAQITVTPTYEATNKTVWSGTIGPFDTAYSLTEVGIKSSDAVMLMRHLWSVVRGVSVGDSIQVTLKATAGR
jgi:hypothetical protein